jgi:hypothetical protein
MAIHPLDEGRAVLQTRTGLARMALLIFAIFDFLMAGIALAQLGGLIDLDAPDLDTGAIIAGILALGYTVVFVATVILVGMWIHRAHANLRLVDGLETVTTPGWAVGWYFIPIANLFKPYQAMKELWASSHGISDRFTDEGQGPLPAWWGCWLIGNIIANVSLRLTMTTGGTATQATLVMDIASSLLMIGSAWFLAIIIRQINETQQSALGMAEIFA